LLKICVFSMLVRGSVRTLRHSHAPGLLRHGYRLGNIILGTETSGKRKPSRGRASKIFALRGGRWGQSRPTYQLAT